MDAIMTRKSFAVTITVESADKESMPRLAQIIQYLDRQLCTPANPSAKAGWRIADVAPAAGSSGVQIGSFNEQHNTFSS
jgi:hypothetical protein